MNLRQKNAYNTVVVGLDAEIADQTKSKDRKTQVNAQLLQQMATDKAGLAEAQTALKDDSKYKKDLETTWAKRTREFKARQQLRTEELEALAKATEIVSGGAVSGASEKHLSLLQSATALVSMPSKRRGANREALAKLLQERAQTLNSFELAAVARKLESAGPFDGVVKLIEDLIAKKQAQGAKEASKQQYCETELAANKKTRSEKTDEVEDLQAVVDKINATIASLGEEVSTLTKDITTMKKAVSEATAVRTKEKTKNTATTADAKAAQAAVAQAIGVLQEFYAKAGQATALVQEGQQQPIPEAMDSKPYQGMGAESGGVVGMMEVIQSDFARLETETTSAESAAASEYEEFMDDSKIDIASKEKDVEHKQDRIEREQQKLLESSSDQKAVQAELDAALKTFEELKPQCADAEASYEEQKQLREQEMATLQQALDALNAAR
jgi:chromosome segregation ATPase